MGDQQGKHQIHRWSLREWLKILSTWRDPDEPDTDQSTSCKLDSLFERREVAQYIFLDIYKGSFEYADSIQVQHRRLPGKLGVYWRPKDGRAESRWQPRSSLLTLSPDSASKW